MVDVAVDVGSDLAGIVDDALASVDVTVLPDAAIADLLPALLHVRARFDAVLTEVIAAADARGLAAAEGFDSAASWLRYAGRVEPVAARRWVKTARTLAELPATRAAFAAGEIDLAGAAAICSATRAVKVGVVREHLETPLLAVARDTDASVVRREVRRAHHTLAPEVVAEETRLGFVHRDVTLSPGGFGRWNLVGSLTPDAAAALQAAFSAFATPFGPGDERTAEQRRHDALAELAARALAAGDLPEVGGERPRVTVTVDAAVLASGAGCGEMSWVGPVSGDAVARLCCDAEIVRAVMSPSGELLDLGRTTRFPSAAQRRALVARDGGCVFPGCTRPAPWTDAHHLRWWSDGGSTDLGNLALVCRFHHRLVHEGGWTLGRDPDGGWTATGPRDRHLHRRRRPRA